MAPFATSVPAVISLVRERESWRWKVDTLVWKLGRVGSEPRFGRSGRNFSPIYVLFVRLGANVRGTPKRHIRLYSGRVTFAPFPAFQRFQSLQLSRSLWESRGPEKRRRRATIAGLCSVTLSVRTVCEFILAFAIWRPCRKMPEIIVK